MGSSSSLSDLRSIWDSRKGLPVTTSALVSMHEAASAVKSCAKVEKTRFRGKCARTTPIRACLHQRRRAVLTPCRRALVPQTHEILRCSDGGELSRPPERRDNRGAFEPHGRMLVSTSALRVSGERLQ